MPAGLLSWGAFSCTRRVGAWLSRLVLLFGAVLLWPALASAQTSTYCPTPLTASVTWGGSVIVDVTACQSGFGGVSGPFAPLAQHGTVTLGPGTGGPQSLTYAHNGSTPAGGGSDTIWLEDDEGGTVRVNITISAPTSAITVSPATLPTLTAGTPFSQTLTSSGGTAPYTYTLQSGSLPVGLSLTSGGVISGTPTQRGSYSFSVRSTDNGGDFVDRGYTGTVQNPSLSIAPTTATAIQGVAFSQTLTATGGVAPHTYQLETGPFPAGISISSAGVVSGTTAAATGSYPVTLRVTDASTPSGAPYFELETFTLTVSAPPSVTIAVSPASVSEDGATNLTYTVTRSLNLSSPTVVNITTSGTATSGADYTGGVATVSIPGGATTATITINPTVDGTVELDETVVLTVAAGTGYTVGAPASATGTILNDDVPSLSINDVTAAEGNAGTTSFTFTVSLSAPAGAGGVTFDIATADGTATAGSDYVANSLTGQTIPAGSSTYTFTVQVNGDALDETGETFFVNVTNVTGAVVADGQGTGTIANDDVSVSVSPATLPNGAVTAAYSQTLAASGGVAPYSFAVTAGALPAGLTLSAGGVLSGTPTAGGTFNFTATATDSSPFPGPFAGSRAYTLVVTPPTIALPATGLAGGTVGSAYSASITVASGGTAPYSYAVTAGALPGGLSLNAATGAIIGTPSSAGTFNFSITATDSSTGTGPYTATQSYAITVTDIPPVANAMSLTVAYNAAATPVTLNITGGVPTSVAVAGAPSHGTAIASGTSITYQPTTGYGGPDSFTYTATNSGGTSAPATVTVTVSDPVITTTASGSFAATVGVPYSQTITVLGGAQPWSGYQVTNLPAGLSITGTTANSVTVSGTPTQAGSFSLTGSATDSSTGNGPYTVSEVYVLTVAAPGLALSPAATTFNTAYAAPYSQSFTASGGTGPYSYALTGSLPAGVSFAGNTVSGTPTVTGSYSFTITATDTGSTGTGAPFAIAQSYTIVVGAPTVVVDPATLPNPSPGVAYSQTLTASGGVAPYSFALTSGSLPAGLTLGSGGVLAGTATQVGSFSFTVTATDNFGQTGSRAYTLVVGAPTLSMAPVAGTLTAPYGSAYTQSFTASGSPGPHTYVLTGALPAGLSFSGSTLSGTPTAPGSYPVTITATDSVLTGTGAPYSVAQNYTIEVAAPTIVMAPATLPEPVAGEAYSQTITATGGVAPYSFAVTGGALPLGLSLSTGGVLSGMTTQVGAFSFTISATDANGQISARSFSMSVTSAPRQTLSKQVLSNADEDGNGQVSLNDTLTYRVTVTNSGFVPLTGVAISDAQINPGSTTCATVLPGQTCVLQGTYRVTAADARARRVVNVATATGNVCAAGSQDAQCRVSLTTQVVAAVVRAKDDDFGELVCPKGDVVVGNAYRNDTLDGRPIRAADIVGTVTSAAKPVKPGKPVPELNTATGDVKVPAGTPGGTYVIGYRICQRSVSNNCDSARIVVKVKQCQVLVRVIKTAQTRQVRVGDFVSYTLQIDNLTENDGEVEGLQIVDTPPPGFSLVPGSVRFQDADARGTASGTGPITLGQIDLAGNGRAYISYLMRVGANARRGDAVNTADPFLVGGKAGGTADPINEGGRVGNTAKAVVVVIADADADDTSIIGKVFLDQDGDGWQDSADAQDVRIQGGIDPAVYVAGSTTVDRGQGAQPEPDASAPLLRGIRIGTVGGRESDDASVPLQRVMISQWVTAPVFSGDTVITSGEGTRVVMAPGGDVRIEHTGDVAAGLNNQDLRVQRTVTPLEGRYRVDYIVTNHGVSEGGIPGVRLASPEGLVVQTDSYGRFHLVGIDAAARAHGRNFVLKVDPVSLPPGARVTTANPLVRRLTGGLMVRFDFGVGFGMQTPAAAPAAK